jgi:peptide/nickel transport system permease protein
MSRYILRRLVQAVPTFLGITLFAFLMMLFAPGDPISLITFNPRSSDTETAERMRRQLGLDKAPVLQYLYWLVGNDWTSYDSDGDGTDDSPGERLGFLRGDLGNSIKHRRPVLDLLLERVPATLVLSFSALILGYSAGILLGVMAAVYHRSWLDQLVRIISVLGNAIPQFWLGLLLIIFFSVTLGILPMSGMQTIGSREEFDLWDLISHTIMPVFVLSLNTIAFVSRFTRTELLEVLEQDFIRTARAKGLSDKTVWWKHALRNALLPVATFLGPGLGSLLAGAVIVERVFSWPGMGLLVVDGVFQRDYPLVMGTVVMTSVMFILGVLLSDVLYAVLDPRIRLK